MGKIKPIPGGARKNPKIMAAKTVAKIPQLPSRQVQLMAKKKK